MLFGSGVRVLPERTGLHLTLSVNRDPSLSRPGKGNSHLEDGVFGGFCAIKRLAPVYYKQVQLLGGSFQLCEAAHRLCYAQRGHASGGLELRHSPLMHFVALDGLHNGCVKQHIWTAEWRARSRAGKAQNWQGIGLSFTGFAQRVHCGHDGGHTVGAQCAHRGRAVPAL